MGGMPVTEYYKSWNAIADSKEEAQEMARAFVSSHNSAGPVYIYQALEYDQETDTIGNLREWYRVECGHWKEYES